jgi:hypothetical protein
VQVRGSSVWAGDVSVHGHCIRGHFYLVCLRVLATVSAPVGCHVVAPSCSRAWATEHPAGAAYLLLIISSHHEPSRTAHTMMSPPSSLLASFW